MKTRKMEFVVIDSEKLKGQFDYEAALEEFCKKRGLKVDNKFTYMNNPVYCFKGSNKDYEDLVMINFDFTDSLRTTQVFHPYKYTEITYDLDFSEKERLYWVSLIEKFANIRMHGHHRIIARLSELEDIEALIPYAIYMDDFSYCLALNRLKVISDVNLFHFEESKILYYLYNEFIMKSDISLKSELEILQELHLYLGNEDTYDAPEPSEMTVTKDEIIEQFNSDKNLDFLEDLEKETIRRSIMKNYSRIKLRDILLKEADKLEVSTVKYLKNIFHSTYFRNLLDDIIAKKNGFLPYDERFEEFKENIRTINLKDYDMSEHKIAEKMVQKLYFNNTKKSILDAINNNERN